MQNRIVLFSILIIFGVSSRAAENDSDSRLAEKKATAEIMAGIMAEINSYPPEYHEYCAWGTEIVKVDRAIKEKLGIPESDPDAPQWEFQDCCHSQRSSDDTMRTALCGAAKAYSKREYEYKRLKKVVRKEQEQRNIPKRADESDDEDYAVPGTLFERHVKPYESRPPYHHYLRESPMSLSDIVKIELLDIARIAARYECWRYANQYYQLSGDKQCKDLASPFFYSHTMPQLELRAGKKAREKKENKDAE